MRCVHCGFQNPEGFDFCGRCGSPLRGNAVRLTRTDLEHLHEYLSPSLVDALRQDLFSPSPQLLAQCISTLTELLQVVGTYLPERLVRRASADPVQAGAGGEFIEGTLLLVDIGELLADAKRADPVGQEQTEGVMATANARVDKLLSVLGEYGGWLAAFTGHALLCHVDDPTRAAHAALRMQQTMADLVPSSQQIKIGLHAGRFFAARLGTHQHMVYALLGSDVSETAAIKAAALPGQIVADRQTLQSVTTSCEIAPNVHDERYAILQGLTSGDAFVGSSRLPVLPTFEPTFTGLRRAVALLDVLSPYLPSGLLSHLVSARERHALPGQHRLVAVLAANLFGLGRIVDRLGPERTKEIAALLNRYFVAMQDTVYRYGGTIQKLNPSVHGEQLLALFGTPIAHEDDADRAVRAALDMREAVNEIARTLSTAESTVQVGLDQKMGIGFGHVLAGQVGSRRRQEYAFIGEQIDLVGRLLAVAAPGEIMVSEAIERQVRDFCQLSARDALTLPGKAQPAVAHAVVAYDARARSLRGLRDMRSPLVGRQAAWQTLLNTFDRLVAGQGQIVSVVGDAGLGKSRILRELRDQVGHTVVWWMQSRCVSYTESVSYWPFQEIVRQMIGIEEQENEEAGWQKLRSVLEESAGLSDIGAVLPYMAAFLGLSGDRWQQERLRHLDAEALQRRTFIAISILLESFARAKLQPIVLVLEDIHWIDQASTSLIEYLLPLIERVPLLLVLVYRPERQRRCWQIHQRIQAEYTECSRVVWLEPLDQADSQALLDNLVPLERWPAEVRSQILERAEGNPLYLEEILRSLIDRQILVQGREGEWQIEDAIDDPGVPDTLQGVIMGRLDRLSESTRWAVQVAAVIGRAFSFDLLANILEVDGEQLNVDLTVLRQHRIIYHSQRVKRQVYAFRHVMVQEACYSSLTVGTRRLYHRRIAAYLAQRHAAGQGELERSYPFIAYHAFAGQDWRLAFEYQFLSGKHAQELFANELAIEHLHKALHSARHLSAQETDERRLEAVVSLGELLTTTGEYDQALDQLLQAREMAAERGYNQRVARACRWLARLHELRSEYMEAVAWIQQGLVALDGAETVEMMQLLLIAGLINTRLGNYESASNQCEICLRVAEELGEIAVLARSYTLLGHLGRLQGNTLMAVWYFQRGLDLYEIAGDINGQAIAHDLIATALFHTGQWQEAERHYRQARELCVLIGNKYSMALADNNLGGIALNQGQLDKALTLYRRALRSLERIGESLYVQGALHVNLGHTFIRRGEAAAAQEHLQIAGRYFEQAQARDWLPEMHRHCAEAALLQGDIDMAHAQAERALETARDLSMRNEEGNSLRVLADVAVAQGHVNRAAQLLQESASILDQAQDEYEWARSVLAQADLALASGQGKRCQEMLDRVEPVFRRLGARLDIAQAEALRARLAAGRHRQTDMDLK